MTLGEMAGLCFIIASATVTAIELPMEIVRQKAARRAADIEKRKARNRRNMARSLKKAK